MADAVWPSALPGPLAGSVTDETLDTRIRTPMEFGPGKMRVRFTASVRRLAFPIIYTGDQLELFDFFFDTTLNRGSGVFGFSDPKLDAPIRARFSSRPKWEMIRGDSVPSGRAWRGVIELEVLPGAP